MSSTQEAKPIILRTLEIHIDLGEMASRNPCFLSCFDVDGNSHKTGGTLTAPSSHIGSVTGVKCCPGTAAL